MTLRMSDWDFDLTVVATEVTMVIKVDGVGAFVTLFGMGVLLALNKNSSTEVNGRKRGT